MIIYRHKQADIKKRDEVYKVYPDLSTGVSGAYTMFDVEPNATYQMKMKYYKSKGDVRLWIASDKNKVIVFNPEMSLVKIRKHMDLCFNTDDIKKIKVGLLFNKPKSGNFFELEFINIKRVNIPTPKKRLAIIVPYRDRLEHLNTFIPFMDEYLKDFDSQVFIIHQKNRKPFNRASLFNVGFDVVKDHFDYYCFHDVDLIAESSDYSFPNEPSHLSMYCSQFDYKRKSMFGGVVIFTREQFEKINGFSNKYWGWGGEDNDLRLRVKQHYKPVYRPGKYKSLPHKHVGSNHKHYKENFNLYMERSKDSRLLKNEGLCDLGKTFKYTILKYKLIDDKCDMSKISRIKYKDKANYMVNVDF